MRIDYEYLHKKTQQLIIFLVCFIALSVFSGLLYLGLLIVGLKLPETFIGLLLGYFALPRAIKLLTKDKK